MSSLHQSPYRRTHRKRISALRLSTDSNVPTLPAYTSPPWQKPVGLPAEEDLSDKPPEYSDSAEEGDADTDSEQELVAQRRIYSPSSSSYVPLTPPLTFSPVRRSSRRSQGSAGSRSSSQRRLASSSSNDPYLDSLLARSVHALEMSNALLQSSISTQTSLSTVLADDSMADSTLEVQARNLSSRINANDHLQDSWLENLDKISEGVEGLFSPVDQPEASSSSPISQSLPTSSSIHSRLRRPSVEFRRARTSEASQSSSTLNYTIRDRNDLISPPPRALTMYIDSTEDPTAITLPSTLGMRSSTHLPPTPIPSDLAFSPPSEPSPPIASRATDLLITLAKPSTKPKTRRSSTSSVTTCSTIIPGKKSKSPPPPIITRRSSSKSSSPQIRSRSISRNGSPVRYKQSTTSLITQPIEELSASSGESSDSNTLHVDKTLESLRNILDKAPASRASSSSRNPPMPRPSLLTPPTVEPVASTSTATASISRLFTKGRHSIRPPSPPRHSSLKVRSTPATPTTSTPSGSMLNVPDAVIGANGSIGFGLGFSRPSSGHSTPKRISFAELPGGTSGASTSRRSRSIKSSRKSRSRSSPRRLQDGDRDQKEDGEDPGGRGWFSSWLLGTASSSKGASSGSGYVYGGLSGPSMSVHAEERYGKAGVGWGARPGFGGTGGMEDWAV
ncbi:hypothetical protein QCA50_000920 [Cerrena zonata]|uniref:Uncharacterized protein n=1 Tax=Cerrena zonata TaxID=2478898 RepID=A0AAW0GZS2_9APHY